MGKKIILILLFLLFSFPLVFGEEFGFNNPTLPQLIQDLFDGKPSSFYMPNNKSVFGNFSFNGGFLNGGCTIRDGAILCQEGFFVNISSLNITQQNLTVINNLTVEGNVSADNFIGTLIGNSSIWSRAGTNIFLTNSGDNVGIGTSNPTQELEVIGSVNITGDLTVDSNTLIVNSANNRVGINTITPQDTLNVIGDANITEDIFSNGFQVISYQRTVNITNVTMTAVI